ncbi:MAG: C_GCAxxG_C_C family protein [Lachnospiraceae bacterium]|nr:C_GCAxxG_C_C family protein [Lachnospiraceae bacterium]
MKSREQIARDAFKEGYNCAQCMAIAFSDVMGIDETTAKKLASSFGGGMGRMREVCGAVSGMFMVAGVLYGYDDPKDIQGKKEIYSLIQELAKQYKEEEGSIICRELLGLEGQDTSPVPSERTKEYYAKRPCEEKIATAARLLEKLI